MAQAIIDLNKLKRNLGRLQQHVQPSVRIMAAVKANAYGHGLVKISQTLQSEGVNWFAVATPAEALNLRSAGITANILVLSPSSPNKLKELIDADVCLTVVDEASIQQAEEAARQLNDQARLHLKVDTGMGRLGEAANDSLKTAMQIDQSKATKFEGYYTHFACTDDADPNYTQMQLERFNEAIAMLKHNGIESELRHAANSAALITTPDSHFDMVRPGIALYGYHGSSYTIEPSLEPILELHAKVTFVKRVSAGQSISYSATWTAEKDTTIASVRYGYGDGYPRALSNIGEVWAADKLCPIRGRVCMDQFMIDLGDDVVQVGDDVVLLGGDAPDADDLGNLAKTISYEVLTGVSQRVEKTYIE